MIPAVAADLAAALEDYRLVTAPGEQTPAGAAEFALEQLAASGWDIRPPAPWWCRGVDRLRALYARLAAEHLSVRPGRRPHPPQAPIRPQEPAP